MRVLVSGAMTHLPGHLASGSAAGFRSLGHEAALHDYLGFRDTVLWKIANRARLRFPAISSLLRAGRCRDLEREVGRYEPDLLLVINGEMFDRATIERIKARGVRTVLWAADNPFQRSKLLAASPAYDRVYVFDPWYLPALREYGVRRAEYLPMACDPSVHRHLDLSEADLRTHAGGICFVGTWYPNRESVLRRLTDFPLHIWGGGWPLALARPSHELRPFFRGRAFGDEVTRIYRSHRVVLNIQHPQSREAQNMRTFEAPACGSLTLTPWTSELPRLFRVDEEIVAYRSIEDLRVKIAYYLAHPEESVRIGEAGRRRAVAEHTYAHRMQRILEAAA